MKQTFGILGAVIFSLLFGSRISVQIQIGWRKDGAFSINSNNLFDSSPHAFGTATHRLGRMFCSCSHLLETASPGLALPEIVVEVFDSVVHVSGSWAFYLLLSVFLLVVLVVSFWRNFLARAFRLRFRRFW